MLEQILQQMGKNKKKQEEFNSQQEQFNQKMLKKMQSLVELCTQGTVSPYIACFLLCI